ncbi:MAG: GNAT family N-acetyltransferase [Gemmatimonadota bacterium]|nr:GNAT family N-acetyltransferase [Gemmatimonadota bacterium]
MIVRPVEARDAHAARAILGSLWGEPSPYAARVHELFDAAASGTSAEQRALVSLDGDAVVGIAIYGHVAGANGAAQLYLIAVAPEHEHQGVGSALLTAVRERLTRDGARVVLAELPDESDVRPLIAVLKRSGFHEEARIADYFRDGVALCFLRLDLSPRIGHSRAEPASSESTDTTTAD